VLTANERLGGLQLAGEVMRWLITGQGILTYSPSIVAASTEVHDGFASDGGRRRRAQGARARGFARHRRLGDAGGHLDQYQRADDHDRGEGSAIIKGAARERPAA
jgi:hypothetical protein